MVKSENKLENFSIANKRLHEAITAYKNNKSNDLYRDALIQRFEFTFELAWKTTTEILKEQGMASPFHSPKSVFKTAYEVGFIEDENVWVKILEDRNFMSHTYNLELAVRISDDICNHYGKAMNNLLKKLKETL